MSAKKFARVLLPSAVFLALVWSLAIPAPAYAVLTPQIVSVNPGSGSQVGSNVCITARIEQDFDYRAMRIRFGNEGWQESSELVFERCFGTGHLSPGWYEIRVEADRLGGNWSNITSATQSYELTPQPQPTQPPPPPKGPDVEFTLTPSGGADIGTKVTIEVWVDSTNPGAIRITVPCGGVPVEHTTPHFKTTWDTDGCGKGTETVRVCARDVNDPNWANQTCSERQYTLSSPPLAAPTAKFWADATSIQSGQCTWLRWTTTNASIVDIDGDVVAASGEMQVCPTITKYYSLKAQGDGGVATRSLGINVYNQAPSPSVTDKFQTGDIIQIGYDIFVIVNRERRLVPNPETLDALGIPRSWINNKGFSDADLKTIPRGEDIPDVARDRAGFDAFKQAYFPNTIPIVPATATPSSQGGNQPPGQTSSTSEVKLIVSPKEVGLGEWVAVTWIDLATTGNDWLGLYRSGASDNLYVKRVEIRDGSGTINIAMPMGSGLYEFRLFRNGERVAEQMVSVLQPDLTLGTSNIDGGYYENPGELVTSCTGQIGEQKKSVWQPLLDLFNAIRSLFSAPPVVLAAEERFQEGQCTWQVAEDRPDVLEWLPPYGADAHTWDDWAIDEDWGAFWGLYVDHNPQAGDIVVWEQSCGGSYTSKGHVAYVTGVRGDTIVVNEANHVTEEHPEGDRRVYYGSEYGVRPFSCMRFIHKPTVFEGEP